jgi:hypothetical protein
MTDEEAVIWKKAVANEYNQLSSGSEIKLPTSRSRNDNVLRGRACECLSLTQMNPSATQSYFFKVHFNTTSHLHLGPWSHYFRLL